MSHPTILHTQKVALNHLNVLAPQLRQAGAKFRSTIHKQEATIVFSALPTTALSILEALEENPITNTNDQSLITETVSASPQEESSILGKSDDLATFQDDGALDQAKASLPEISLNQDESSYPLATEEQLRKLSKTKLKKLAYQYNIKNPNKLEHQQLVIALINRVPLHKL